MLNRDILIHICDKMQKYVRENFYQINNSIMQIVDQYLEKKFNDNILPNIDHHQYIHDYYSCDNCNHISEDIIRFTNFIDIHDEYLLCTKCADDYDMCDDCGRYMERDDLTFRLYGTICKSKCIYRCFNCYRNYTNKTDIKKFINFIICNRCINETQSFK